MLAPTARHHSDVTSDRPGPRATGPSGATGRPALSRRLLSSIRAITLLAVLGVALTACPQHGRKGASLWGDPPVGRLNRRVGWFRATFVKLALQDARSRDQVDRIGRLVRAMPKLAGVVYRENLKLLERATRTGAQAERVATWYGMNAVIAQVLSPASVKRPPDRGAGERPRRRR